jgi:lipopolysaccharide transport protein LptA
MRMKKKVRLILGMGLIVWVVMSLSSTAFAQKELVVSSSQQRIDYTNRILFYKGKVKATWEDLLLLSDEMEVYLTKENDLKEVVAKGNVSITQGNKKRKATGQMATYTGEDNKLIIQGDAHYHDEVGNDLLAEKITIWIGIEKLEAEGAPVQAIYALGSLREEEEVGSQGGKSQ